MRHLMMTNRPNFKLAFEVNRVSISGGWLIRVRDEKLRWFPSQFISTGVHLVLGLLRTKELVEKPFLLRHIVTSFYDIIIKLQSRNFTMTHWIFGF